MCLHEFPLFEFIVPSIVPSTIEKENKQGVLTSMKIVVNSNVYSKGDRYFSHYVPPIGKDISDIISYPRRKCSLTQ